MQINMNQITMSTCIKIKYKLSRFIKIKRNSADTLELRHRILNSFSNIIIRGVNFSAKKLEIRIQFRTRIRIGLFQARARQIFGDF